MIYKALHRKLKIEQHEPLKTVSEPMCPGKVNRLFRLHQRHPRPVTPVANPFVSHKWRKDQIMITTNETYYLQVTDITWLLIKARCNCHVPVYNSYLKSKAFHIKIAFYFLQWSFCLPWGKIWEQGSLSFFRKGL
jgi:hypothetical protein